MVVEEEKEERKKCADGVDADEVAKCAGGKEKCRSKKERFARLNNTGAKKKAFHNQAYMNIPR